MTGKGLICKLGSHQVIEGADRIVQVDMFGETIITQKTNKEGTIGILFDCETQLTIDYAGTNNMFRHSNLNKDKNVIGYMDDNGRIKPIKLKGVKCSGLWMPLESLLFTESRPIDLLGIHFTIGSEISEINGIKICRKYISPKTAKTLNNKEGKVKENLTPTFKEHFDTDQWGRNMDKAKIGNLITITEKLHGTSARCGYLPTIQKQSWWKKLFNIEVPTKYNFVVGSRRVVKSISGEEINNKEHFYDTDLWTKVSKKYFEDKLHKGETVYFEIVGYTPEMSTIMPSVPNDKLKKFLDKNEYKLFIELYGDTTVFNYNCSDVNLSLNEVYVYRITQTNDDGQSIDYSWQQVKIRCEQLNVNHVPELSQYIEEPELDDEHKYTTNLVNILTDEQSEIFPNHVREGVCIRIDNGNLTPLVLKNKSFIFKVLEGIIKDKDVVDLEESN